MQLTLDEIHDQLNLLISATPSGDVRNSLCDANIHLMVALGYQLLQARAVPAGTTEAPSWAGPLLRRNR